MRKLVAVTAEWLVDSISGLADTGKIQREFIGVILLPIVGNAAGKFSFVDLLTANYLLNRRTRYCCDCLRQGQIEP